MSTNEKPAEQTTGFSYHLIRVEDDGKLVGIELDDRQVSFETYFEPRLGASGVTLGRIKIGLSGQQVDQVKEWWRES